MSQYLSQMISTLEAMPASLAFVETNWDRYSHKEGTDVEAVRARFDAVKAKVLSGFQGWA